MPSILKRKEKANDEEKVRLTEEEELLAEDSATYGTEKEKKSKKKKEKSRPFFDLFRYATGWDRFLLVVGSLLSLVTGTGWPFMSTLLGGLSNTFLSAQNSYNTPDWVNSTSDATGTSDEFVSSVSAYCLRYVYLGLVVFVAGCIQMVCWLTACEHQIDKIRKAFFRSILRQNIAWFDEHQTGEMTTKLSDNLERIKEGIGDKCGLLLQYCAQFVAGFIIAFTYSWKLTLVMMSLTPLIAASGAFMSTLIAKSTRREQENYAVAGSIAEEVFSCIRTVTSFNGQEREASRYEEALQKGKKDGMMKSLFTGVGLAVTFLVIFCTYALAFWYGSVLVLSGDIERGTVFVVFFSVMMGSFALGNAAPQISTVATSRGSAGPIYDIIDRVPEIDNYSLDGVSPSQIKGRIEFDKVNFSYPTRKQIQVLKDNSFVTEPGETVALVGHTGCGKSTVINLLLRFYDIDSGKLTIDDVSVQDWNLNYLRNLIGVVNQEPILFETTIEDNIKLGDRISHHDMVRATKMSNAHEFIMGLPHGYETMVGEGGSQLSGGQKQRIAIARALVRDPKILLLDEATSALDAESEGIVQEALDKARQGRTTIIIAHRLSTIRNADKILAFDDGAIKEIGTHQQLMQQKGLYHQLVMAQIFEDSAAAASDYASGTDALDTKPESEDSGTDVSESAKKRIFRKRRSKGRSSLSDTDYDSEAERQRRKPSRMLSKKDTETERLQKEMVEEGLQKSTLLEIMRENRTEWKYNLVAFLGSIIRGCVMPAFAFFYGEMFNSYSYSGDELRDNARKWAIVFVGIGIIQGLSLFTSSFFFGVSGEILTMRLRLKCFKNVLRQDISYFDDPKHSTGKICTRLATDAPNVRAACDYRLATVLSSVITMIAGLIIALAFGWKMALMTLAMLPIVAAGGYMSMRIRTGRQKRDAELLEEAGKTAAEAIESIRTVQALAKENYFHEQFCRHLLLPHQQATKNAYIQGISFAFAQSVFFFFYAVSFRWGAYLVQQNEMAPTSVFRVFFAISFCGMTIGWATAYFPEFIKARFSAALIFKLMREEPMIDSSSPLGLKPALVGNINFAEVFFNYPTRMDAHVLKGLNFELSTGKTLALVGQSGCGKSTVVSLIQRFYDPLDGLIKIDDYDLRTLNIMHLRSFISPVSQEPVLFDCSIRDNIAYGLKDEPSEEKIIEAAKLANIHDFVISLPKGYFTRVGEKGTQLSGGQKQRVAIARALVREPKILLLDEATSALDTESEKIVQEALDRARQGRTCIIVAHRLSTVQTADSIAVIKDGKVVEQGSHNDLIAQKGVYYSLTKKQTVQQ